MDGESDAKRRFRSSGETKIGSTKILPSPRQWPSKLDPKPSGARDCAHSISEGRFSQRVLFLTSQTLPSNQIAPPLPSVEFFAKVEFLSATAE